MSYLVLLTTAVSPDIGTWGKLTILVQCHRNRCRVARAVMMVIMMAMEQKVKYVMTVCRRRRSAAIASSEGNYIIARLYGDGTVTCSA